MQAALSALKIGSWLTRDRVLIYPFIVLFASIFSTAAMLVMNGGLLPNGSPFGSDFVSFWVAAREAISGNPGVPYNPALFEPAQKILFPESGYFAFFYPPHYLAYMLPVGLMGYYWALVIWMVSSFSLALWAIAKISHEPKLSIVLLLAFPATFLTVAHGQNAFLSAGLFALALSFLRSNQILAGILFGLLTFKPQLGVLIPLALIAGGYWVTVFSAAITLLLLVVVSSALFGIDIWWTFMGQSDLAVQTMREGIVAWEKMISPYAAFRLAGASDLLASLVHWTLAAAVAISVCTAWLKRDAVSFELRAALLVCGAMLVTPFSLNYDYFIIAIALTYFYRARVSTGFAHYEASLLAAMFAAPVLALLFMPLGISIIPFFTVVFWMFLVRRFMAVLRPASAQATLSY